MFHILVYLETHVEPQYVIMCSSNPSHHHLRRNFDVKTEATKVGAVHGIVKTMPLGRKVA
jgi:hypothetical protein